MRGCAAVYGGARAKPSQKSPPRFCAAPQPKVQHKLKREAMASLKFLFAVYHLGIHIADFIYIAVSNNLTLGKNYCLVAKLSDSVSAV